MFFWFCHLTSDGVEMRFKGCVATETIFEYYNNMKSIDLKGIPADLILHADDNDTSNMGKLSDCKDFILCNEDGCNKSCYTVSSSLSTVLVVVVMAMIFLFLGTR